MTTTIRTMPTVSGTQFVDLEWLDRAACVDKPHDWFHPSPGSMNYRRARNCCLVCPVRFECLDDAMESERDVTNDRHRHGMRGGLTPPERAAMALATCQPVSVRKVLSGVVDELGDIVKHTDEAHLRRAAVGLLTEALGWVGVA